MSKPGKLIKIPTCISETYYVDTPTASMAKLAPGASAAKAAGYVTFHDPGLIDRDKWRELHDPPYVRAIITGKGPHQELLLLETKRGIVVSWPAFALVLYEKFLCSFLSFKCCLEAD